MKKFLLFICLLTTSIITMQAQKETCPVGGIDIQLLPENPTHPVVRTGHAAPSLPSGQNNERRVIWVHGKGGHMGSWARAGEASEYKEYNTSGFEARKLQSKYIEYDETTTLLNASVSLRDKLNAVSGPQISEGNINPNRNFIIGHSQGGMVASTLLYKDFCSQPMDPNQRYYGGLVTVGSPLQGAYGLDHIDDIVDMSDEACTAFASGPTLESTLGQFKILSWFIEPEAVLSVVGDACGFLEDEFISALGEMAQQGTVNEYKIDSQPINWINNCQTDGISRVAFYGREAPENLMWRTLDYFINKPNQVGHWEANSDEGYISNIVEENLLKFKAKEEWYSSVVTLGLANGFPCETLAERIWRGFGNCNDFDLAISVRDAYGEGSDWIESADDQYKLAIGALQKQEPQTVEYCECITNENGEWSDVVYPGPCTPNDGCSFSHTIITTEIAIQEYESDGLVLAESAMNHPYTTYFDAQGNPAAVRLENSSHMQQRNNTALKDALTNLYNGDYGPFFSTEIRP
jgi:hypothetical protein